MLDELDLLLLLDELEDAAMAPMITERTKIMEITANTMVAFLSGSVFSAGLLLASVEEGTFSAPELLLSMISDAVPQNSQGVCVLILPQWSHIQR